ncbi:hypothetical protein ACD578_28490 (plasmid) [Microvirga sp. RSM25]|uniref:hypothetical protein n=1 Tax=Microvirga sp. RSM25 TaxID=3273802 RepID=UPI00384CE865
MVHVVQLNDTSLRDLKRKLQNQLESGSAHLSEAIAKALGFNTHAALKAGLSNGHAGRYVRFDEESFRERLAALSGEQAPTSLSVPSLGHHARYIQGFFNNPDLEIVEMRPERARFRLAEIPTGIEIRLERMERGFRFIRSHAIKTPTQIGPYYPGRDFDDDPAYAMNRSIESIASYYRQAVEAGHKPDRSWLV